MHTATKTSKRKKKNSFSIVIETENLSMAEINDLEASLSSIKNQKFPIDKAEEVLLIISGHLSKKSRGRIEQKYTWVTLYEAKENLAYTEAKVRGAEIAKGDIIVYADSDVQYENLWLGNILEVFASCPDAEIVGGDTRVSIDSSYSFSLNLTWMFNIQRSINLPEKSDAVFHLNNFAIRRETMLQVPFPLGLPFYRSHITIWKKRLVENGIAIYRAPGTRGHHAAPDSFLDWWYRMLINGADIVTKADYFSRDNGEVVLRRSLKKRLRIF